MRLMRDKLVNSNNFLIKFDINYNSYVRLLAHDSQILRKRTKQFRNGRNIKITLARNVKYFRINLLTLYTFEKTEIMFIMEQSKLFFTYEKEICIIHRFLFFINDKYT